MKKHHMGTTAPGTSGGATSGGSTSDMGGATTPR